MGGFYLNFYALPVFFAGCISLWLASLGFRRSNSHGERYFALLMTCCAIYCFFYGLELSVSEFKLMRFFIKVEYLGAAFLAPLLALFTMKFAGIKKYTYFPVSGIFFIIPLLNLSVVLTNDIHGLFHQNLRSEYNGYFNVLNFETGFWYWLHQIYAIIAVITSNIIFLRLITKVEKIYVRQVFIMLLGSLSAWLAHLAYLLGLMPLNLDPVPFAFTFSGSIIYLGFIKFKLFSLAPVAYKTLFNVYDDSVFVFDKDLHLIQSNLSAQQLVSSPILQPGDHIQLLAFQLKGFDINQQSISDRKILEFSDVDSEGEPRWYKAQFFELFEEDNPSILMGYLLKIIDITWEKKTLIQSLQIQNLIQTVAEISNHLLRNPDLKGPVLESTSKLLEYGEIKHFGLIRNISPNQHVQYIWNLSKDASDSIVLENSMGNILEQYRLDLEMLDVVLLNQEMLNEFYPEPQDLVQIKNLLFIPVLIGEKIEGILYFTKGYDHPNWTDDVIAVLKSLARTISAALNRILLEKQLNEVADAAQKANNAKSEFLANMSHEIRTPLNGIIGFSDLMSMTKLDKDQAEYMEIINYSGKALLALVNDILDFSKIEAGAVELQYNQISLHQFISQIVDMMSIKAREKKLILNYSIDPSLPEWIIIDEDRLRQILINLISNAVKFTDVGKIDLKVDLLESNELDHFTLCFKIIDTGIGISPDKHEKILQPFIQEDNSITKKYGGTGLGLTITNNLLKLMGSHLQLISDQGKGSTFFFNLEVKGVLLPNDQASKRTSINDYKDDINTDKYPFSRILIVEDNTINAKVLHKTLDMAGVNAEIKIVKDGESALDCFESFLPEIVFMDGLLAGELNGNETIEAIRNLEKKMVHKSIIISISGAVFEEDKAIAMLAGADLFLLKPIDQHHLTLSLLSAQKILFELDS